MKFSPESEPCTHMRTHAPACGQQAAKEEQRVGSCFPTGFPPTCRSASCASESEVSGRRRAGRKSHRRQGDLTAEGSERRIK